MAKKKKIKIEFWMPINGYGEPSHYGRHENAMLIKTYKTRKACKDDGWIWPVKVSITIAEPVHYTVAK